MKTVSQLDVNGYFVGPAIAYESPLEAGVLLIPAGAVAAAPPVVPQGKAALWSGKDWVFVVNELQDQQVPSIDGVPQEVTAFQARAALANSGYLEVVTAYMDTLSPNDVARLAWEHAQTFKRTSPTIAGLAPLLGMTEAQLDQLFIAAAQIDA